MIDIVGGVYLEKCHWPARRALFGSGGRAAAAISKLTRSIRLHTYVGDRERDTLESLATTFGFSLNAITIKNTVAFEYFHGLSTPIITPARREPVRPITVRGDQVLRYGFIEGDAVVTGESIVYDPQNVFRPTLFTENGSRADRLAVILNRSEGILLTNKRQPADIVKTVAEAEGAEVVVLKLGALGAMVWDRGKIKTISCFKTDYVWPIGSGDVFAAVFFAHWATIGQNAVEAANNASYATALYCNSEVLPIEKKALRKRTFQPVSILPSTTRRRSGGNIVYLAGPFFNIAQRWLIEEIRSALRASGISVFSPFHDVGHGAADDVAVRDLEGLKRSSVVLAVLDGLDSGTLFEVGYARAQGIPVIALVQNESSDALKMVQGTDCRVERDLVTAIYQTIWAVLDNR